MASLYALRTIHCKSGGIRVAGGRAFGSKGRARPSAWEVEVDVCEERGSVCLSVDVVEEARVSVGG